MRSGTIWFLLNLIVGLYFSNMGLNLINLQFLDSIKNWIILAGGFLMIIDGIMVWNRSSGKYRR